MESILVAYFSATGTTRRAALALADYLDAGTFEIVPEVPYSSADDMSAYETIYVGFPIWWYVEPRIIDTFLESYDMAGKTIIPFATSGGSGLGKTAQHMQGVCPQAIVEQGFMLNDYSADKLASLLG